MNTLEMAIKLRSNPELKAHCVVGDKLWKVKCVNGSIMWNDDREPEFLNMSDCVLKHCNWNVYREEKREVEIFFNLKIQLEKGIGELPYDKDIIGDIYVHTSDDKLHTIRPIGKMFSVPTDDKLVNVMCKCKVTGIVCTFKARDFH